MMHNLISALNQVRNAEVQTYTSIKKQINYKFYKENHKILYLKIFDTSKTTHCIIFDK